MPSGLDGVALSFSEEWKGEWEVPNERGNFDLDATGLHLRADLGRYAGTAQYRALAQPFDRPLNAASCLLLAGSPTQARYWLTMANRSNETGLSWVRDSPIFDTL